MQGVLLFYIRYVSDGVYLSAERHKRKFCHFEALHPERYADYCNAEYRSDNQFSNASHMPEISSQKILAIKLAAPPP